MRLPNLLATRKGRLAAFFLLYVTEGLPLGFVATAVATQMRRMGVGPAEIGAMVAAFYLPWAFKWAMGPLVDVLRSQRFGHRRAWIGAMQMLMAASVLGMQWVPLPGSMSLFIAVLLLHNAFGATQDVAIDALAVNALAENERGLANGLMFAGAQIGQAIGGAGVLFVAGISGFAASYAMVATAILAVTLFVVLPLREPAPLPGAGAAGGLVQALGEMRGFVEQSFRSFLGSRGALTGVLVALLPNGAMALSLALQTNLAVELGMDDDAVAALALVSTVLGAVGMVAGGWASDRWGRRRTLALFLLLMSLPTLGMAWALWQAGYGLPRPAGSAPMPELVRALWSATPLFSLAMGLMYGPRTAVYMDITNPRVAATQFTAYMAMLNVSIAFAATWQGLAVEAVGYAGTLAIDAAVGLLALPLLPWLRPPAQGFEVDDGPAEGRARRCAGLLALACLAFVPWWGWRNPQGALAGVANTVFTLVFVASALLLLASSLLQRVSAPWRGAARAGALVLLLLYARRFLPAEVGGAAWPGHALVMAAALAAAWLLLQAAWRPWPGLSHASRPPASVPAPAAASDPGPAAGRESAAG